MIIPASKAPKIPVFTGDPDLGLPEEPPRILISVPDQVTEHDCACPVPPAPALHAAAPEQEMIWVEAPELLRLPLPEGHTLIFNPFGPSSAVVLNQPALRILQAFKVPGSTAAQVIEHYRHWGSEAASIPGTLAALGLVRSQAASVPALPAQPDTLTAWLHVTNACNLRCSYCYLNKNHEKLDIERGRQAVEAVFRSAQANGYARVKLKYAGGEALLNLPALLAMHDHARHLAQESGIQVDGVVLSNGVLLSEAVIDALVEHQLRLSISLDGVGEQHDATRHYSNGKGSFAQIEGSLDRLARRGIRPSITITLTNRNLDGLPKIVDYVLKRELPFSLNFYRENDCSASVADLAYNEEQIVAAMEAAFAVIEANLPAYSLLGTLVDRARLDAPHQRPCGVGDSYLVIDQNGQVAKCHMEIEHSVTDIHAADPLQLVRMDTVGIQNRPVDEKEGCRDCTWRYRCAGGCPALTYRATGRYDVKSPNCQIYQRLFPQVLRLEGLRLLKQAAKN